MARNQILCTLLDEILIPALWYAVCNGTWCVCEFHITSHLCSASGGGGATNRRSHALYIGVSYISSLACSWDGKLYPINRIINIYEHISHIN